MDSEDMVDCRGQDCLQQTMKWIEVEDRNVYSKHLVDCSRGQECVQNTNLLLEHEKVSV